MDMRQFQSRFSQSLKAPQWFLRELEAIHAPLDCYFNRVEERWQVIQWEGSPRNSRWYWVMTIQSPDKGPMLPNSYALDRVRWIKKIFEQNEALKMAELEQMEEEERQRRHTRDYTHELAKDIRRPLLYQMDGLVTSINRFV